MIFFFHQMYFITLEGVLHKKKKLVAQLSLFFLPLPLVLISRQQQQQQKTTKQRDARKIGRF